MVEKLSAYLPQDAYTDRSGDKTLDGEDVQESAPATADEILEFEPEDEDDADGSGDFGGQEGYDTNALIASGVGLEEGMKYCGGNASLYFELLDDFIPSCEKRLEELRAFYASEDMHGYEIVVHAMKSNLRIIGFTSCSEQARNLEKAAKNKDIRYIRDHHGAFLKAVEDAETIIRNAAVQGSRFPD